MTTPSTQSRTHLQAVATVPASFAASPGPRSPACTLLCLTAWGSEAAGGRSSEQREDTFHHCKHTDYRMHLLYCVQVLVLMRGGGGSTSGCEGLFGLLMLWSSLGKVVSMLGGLRKRLSSCCWLSLRLWMMLQDCCCFCERAHKQDGVSARCLRLVCTGAFGTFSSRELVCF